MQMNPLVTIAIPAYKATHLAASLRSAVEQTYQETLHHIQLKVMTLLLLIQQRQDIHLQDGQDQMELLHKRVLK